MSRVAFAHASEAELARLFDFYRITWQYEPHSFPIAWNEQGRPVEFFTPDFYLPEYDLYIELTVAKPVRNSRKNRKLRLACARITHASTSNSLPVATSNASSPA